MINVKQEILELEKEFSNNEYFGTNVWTEEKYRVISGSIPVILSAPHSVNQIRDEEVRNAEKYTGALVKYLSSKTNCYCIFELFTHSDPNSDLKSQNDYKNAVINLINNYKIKILIDIHSSLFTDDTDIDIVTNKRESLCGANILIDEIKRLSSKYDVTMDEHNEPNKEKENEVITTSSKICNIPSIRIVINNKKLDVETNEEKFTLIEKLLEEFIKFCSYL